ncbi:MAG: hypothetical protein H0T47_21020 [Planctomycetaceae bacterium]|nr:hypothetical protein [Planctomycetaceae bacterium]
MDFSEIAVLLSLAGFHVTITLLALYRARVAWVRSAKEGRADRRTLWRLAFLRFIAFIVALSGGTLAIATPLMLASAWGTTILPTTVAGTAVMICGAWFIWIPSTIALDNLALRWLKRGMTNR